MRGGQFIRYFFGIMLLAMVATSCRKDEDIKAPVDEDTSTAVTPGSFLAASGKLTINLNDTTYTFDAATDSIAFIKVDTAGSRYFGVAAINKAHTTSFGISGLGIAASKAKVKVAGSQLLFSGIGRQPTTYTLNRSAHELDLGELKLRKYNDTDKASAKGTFTAFMSKDTIPGATLYKVTGSFDLKLK